MGNWTFLKGCSSVGAAVEIATGPGDPWEPAEPDLGPVYAAKYRVPLFWLAGFSTSDAVTIKLPFRTMEDEEFFEDLIMLCAPASKVTQRLRSRRAIMLGAVHPDYAELFDKWILVFEAHFPQWVMLEASDVFTMNGIAEGSAAMLDCLRALDAADAGAPFVLAEAFESLGAVDPNSERLYREADAMGVAESRMYGLVGSADEESWLPEPTPALMRLATEALANRISPEDFFRTAKPKPWWAFWRPQ